ncbi:Fcf2 pre-rRNA processing-domain-containing protein [Mycena belliarum]|uniref:Fcf2 pre-rRNA processing-domain-containing protein n=1 Tax=Mycena belliarum TaxID=1033014 RepID=A0AAD6UAW7_9AGAR|nr:Fcf2 pre-rRNA processing-domain-containing protein [Mycena belliae]
MSSSAAKGKQRALSSEPFNDSEPEVTPEYLQSLLNEARENARAAKQLRAQPEEDDVIVLQAEPAKLPSLDPGVLPRPYFTLGKRRGGPSSMRDPDVELAEKASSLHVVPAPPIPPPELTKSGKPLTKRERKELKNQTAGPDWFDLAAPAEADLPRLYREVEALRLRNHLDPKRFYRKDEGEGKGIKGLPKHFAIGTIITSTTPFGTPSADNLTRAERKRTLVDELVDDAEAKRYAKRKFEDLQVVRGAKGRNTLGAKKALRRGKW